MIEGTVVAATPGQKLPSYSSSSTSGNARKRLKHLVQPHVDSFNFFLDHGLDLAIEDIPAMDIRYENNNVKTPFIRLDFVDGTIQHPTKNDDLTAGVLTPRECRERGISYDAEFSATLRIQIIHDEDDEYDTEENNNNTNNVSEMTCQVKLGRLPIMVMSGKCRLLGKAPEELVDLKEEANEMGGYFIMNGLERVIRLLQVPRRNFAAAIERTSYKNRGKLYTKYGVAMRCVRPDQSSVTVTMHYLSSGACTLRFVLRKQELMLPVAIVAKALAAISDKDLYDRLVQGDHNNTFLTSRVELLLQETKKYKVYSQKDSQIFLGSLFRGMLPIADRTTDEEAGKMLLQRYILVHTDSMGEKLECLLHMTRKLYAFTEGRCKQDNQDALCNHELLLPGHLYTMYVKEKMEEILLKIKQVIYKDASRNLPKFLGEIQSVLYFKKVATRLGSNLGKSIGSFLSSGNIITSSGMDLSQVSGYTIIAERLNIFRYMSHFQSVHRGQYFTTMKTTTVRKLLPESWGFLCPVHTPDGSPCGLLNHLARDATLVTHHTDIQLPNTSSGPFPENYKNQEEVPTIARGLLFKRLLVSYGMIPSGLGGGDGFTVADKNSLAIVVDGVVYGSIPNTRAKAFVDGLRYLKVTGKGVRLGIGLSDSSSRRSIASSGGHTSRESLSMSSKSTNDDLEHYLCLDPTLELAYTPASMLDLTAMTGGAFPAIYIFSAPGRMLRPVLNLKVKQIEYIGPMEQLYMNIACVAGDIKSETTHIELQATAMLSHVAALTPYSDYNQSPRNMYQCQMGKQTMGTPAHSIRQRTDNKLYRIQNPQVPLVQNRVQREYQMDEYPQGTNAIVAVIAYTGYDMEDAMIINKGAFDRGFGDGCVYKTYMVDLEKESIRLNKENSRPKLRFSNIKAPPLGRSTDLAGEKFHESLDIDGLPLEGQYVEYGDPLVCIVDLNTGESHVTKHKDSERAYVQTVRVIGGSKVSSRPDESGLGGPIRVSYTLRFPRRPIIGDKFSSRHGQKGTLSVLWPQEDMPFSENGISPDVLINPHAFPSRMTIGMLIESMAGKAGAMHGYFPDSTPFQFHEENTCVDFIGEQLTAAGYHYHGSEPLYSGIHGTVMHANIFMGVVYYQRLRHMVSDKAQVRSTGSVMALTHQPVKGRKRGGGIRLGEMERDALLSHGVAFCLHDRLMNCSDAHIAKVCSTCGSLLSVKAEIRRADHMAETAPGAGAGGGRTRIVKYTCSTCKTGSGVRNVRMPYVYRYLTNELAAMGIKLTLTLSE